MKSSIIVYAALAMPLLAAVGIPFSPSCLAQNQPGGLIPMGNTNMPAGQYMMTNMNSGQSYYVLVNGTGQLLVQDPRALQFNVQPLAAATTAGATSTAQPAQPNAPATPAGGFSSILKQGLDTFLQTRTQPAQ
ncbi:MAG TPA: hypothetical protein PKN86_04790 [Candidatus Obscuribacter sp.]|nr:hypothetical protein [Candidatus Obscuribacter sp.]HMX44650.1 hypothetical protein [Candidatus Obscuribacter sp.]HMY03072.1 hypothetical protein [Candidatus Obscuribacter sp.]HNA73088.1 hypothetical protein [Candidatus Obscuribacter sp.]HNB15199.1 hypothetical protein [Candidatus Obscuribacter sp.]